MVSTKSPSFSPREENSSEVVQDQESNPNPNTETELREVSDSSDSETHSIAKFIAAFFVLWLLFGNGTFLLCNILGFLYPAYASVLAVESPGKNDDTRWLMYWVVFALFSVIEFFLYGILVWYPSYWLVKCVLLLSCFIPIKNNGANLIYHWVVRPLFLSLHFIRKQGEIANCCNGKGIEDEHDLFGMEINGKTY